jgi:hypothetical protein
MTASAGPALKELHRDFGDDVSFLTLYVREAHPGDHYRQPATFEAKLDHARAYRERDDIPWPVAVDDVEGPLHRQLDPKPNAAYLVGEDGIVLFRSLWSNDESVLREPLRRVAAGEQTPMGEREPRLVPMLAGTGKMYEILRSSGPTAQRDVLRQVPPMYAMARLAAMFRPLSPLNRGLAAAGVIAAGTGAAAAAARRAVTPAA